MEKWYTVFYRDGHKLVLLKYFTQKKNAIKAAKNLCKSFITLTIRGDGNNQGRIVWSGGKEL